MATTTSPAGQAGRPGLTLTRLAAELSAICGPASVLDDPLELRTYECDGLTAHRASPGLVVLPEVAEQVAAVVAACARAGVPFVARGSGTGLSGGALPRTDGVLIVMSKMRRIISVDPASRRAIVEPGVTNLAVSQAVARYGLFYAPDPSSQVVCSVGGNVAENSGGAHCLKHGFTVHHVTGLQVVTPSGELTWLGDGTGAANGYDLLGAFTAGTYVFTEKFLKTNPNTVRTFVNGVAKAIEWSRTTPRDQVVARKVDIVTKRGRNEDVSALKYWKSTGVAEKGGRIVDKELSLWIDWLVDRGEVKPDQVKVADLYTNEYNDVA